MLDCLYCSRFTTTSALVSVHTGSYPFDHSYLSQNTGYMHGRVNYNNGAQLVSYQIMQDMPVDRCVVPVNGIPGCT